MKNFEKAIQKMSNDEKIETLTELVKNLKPKTTKIEDVQKIQELKMYLNVMDFYKGFKNAINEKPRVRSVLSKLKNDERFKSHPNSTNTVYLWLEDIGLAGRVMNNKRLGMWV